MVSCVQLRIIGIVDACMNGVERINFYTTNIAQEKQTVVENSSEVESSLNWPQCGLIVAENVQMRYRDGPLVLKGASFEVKAGEKIGIVGRTGESFTANISCYSTLYYYLKVLERVV